MNNVNVKYVCDCCNYETDTRQYFYKHKKSKKHIKKESDANKVNLLVNPSKPLINCENDNPDKTIIKCDSCDKILSCKQSLSRHRKICKNNGAGTLDEKYELLLKVKLQEQKIELLEEQIKDNKEDKKKLLTIAETTAKNNEISLNALNYVMKYFSSAPPIQIFQNYDILLVGNEKFSLPEILCHYNNKNELPKYICDKLLPEYIKKDSSQQAIWNSDTNRLTYLLKESSNKGSTWNRDKDGVKLINYTMKPLMEYSKKHLITYIKDLTDKLPNTESSCILGVIDKLKSANELLIKIENESLHKDVIKCMAPYFYLDRQKYIDKI